MDDKDRRKDGARCADDELLFAILGRHELECTHTKMWYAHKNNIQEAKKELGDSLVVVAQHDDLEGTTLQLDVQRWRLKRWTMRRSTM